MKEKRSIVLTELKTMYLIKKIFIVFSVLFVVLSLSAMSAEATAPVPPAAQPGVDTAGQQPVVQVLPEEHAFPYVAEIIGNDVYVRSGPGTAYYHCGKLNAPSQVIVTGSTHGGWMEIYPPPGSFSWISKSYVRIDQTHTKIGVVTGDAVRVWTGSEFVEPMRSEKLQVKLNHGDTVELIGEASIEGEYYKIVPPTGARLWVNGDFLKYVGPVEEQKPPVVPAEQKQPEQIPTEQQPVPVVEKQPEPVKEEKPAEPAPPTKETLLLKRCYQISAGLDAEIKKPLPQQNYTEYKKAIAEILADPEAGKAQPYAIYLQDRIGRYELAGSIGSQLQKQDQQLTDARKEIEQARQARLNQLVPKQEIIMSGILKPSHVYTGKIGQKRFLLTNDEGKILCYVVLADSERQGQLEQLLNTKVGLFGRIVNSPNEMVTLVTCTDFKPVQKGN